MLGWPKKCKLAHAFLWEHSDKMLKLAQLLGQLGVVLTHSRRSEFYTGRCTMAMHNGSTARSWTCRPLPTAQVLQPSNLDEVTRTGAVSPLNSAGVLTAQTARSENAVRLAQKDASWPIHMCQMDISFGPTWDAGSFGFK